LDFYINWYKKAIISPETAKVLRVEKQLPEDTVFTKAIQNTKGARITEDGLELEIFRNQHPNQSGDYSVRSGVFYQPFGSMRKEPYSGRSGYGGTEKIKGITLLRKPLFVKGATGGKAPQMAYDFIKGKGFYEKMRSEVISFVLSCSYNKFRPREIYEKIYLILEKYGGDTNLTGDIEEFRLRTKGNNLAYAIQENIVANVVRSAG